MKVLTTEKPKVGPFGISDPVNAITEDGILVHPFWDGKEWHEVDSDGYEVTYTQGIAAWEYLPKNWIYDSEYYSIGYERVKPLDLNVVTRWCHENGYEVVKR
jgi:hypothetical protein